MTEVSNSTKAPTGQAYERRTFILGLAGLAAGASVFSSFGGQLVHAAKSRKLGVALVGLGGYSRDWLAPALTETQHCELRGIVTGSPEKVPLWQKRYNIADKNVYSYDTMHKLADNPDIDVAYIVTPTGTHMQYSLLAANAGKHVWCEKPMAMSVAECQKIIDTCNKNKVSLSIGYRLQHEPNTIRFGNYAQQNMFGKVKAIDSRAGYAGQPHPEDYWRMKKAMGGGAMYDMGVYPVNGARYLTKLEPIAITARHEKKYPNEFKEVDQTTVFTLEFPNGVQANCATSVVESYNKARIDCEKGWYELDPMSRYRGVKGRDSRGKNFPAISGRQQTLQMDSDALAIINRQPVRVPGIEGLRDIRIVEAAFESAKNNSKRMLI